MLLFMKKIYFFIVDVFWFNIQTVDIATSAINKVTLLFYSCILFFW